MNYERVVVQLSGTWVLMVIYFFPLHFCTAQNEPYLQ